MKVKKEVQVSGMFHSTIQPIIKDRSNTENCPPTLNGGLIFFAQATLTIFLLFIFQNNREEVFCHNYCPESCMSSSFNGVTRRRCWGAGEASCQRHTGEGLSNLTFNFYM